MKFFVDTADVKEIRELESYGLLDGVTTNPSLILKIRPSDDRGHRGNLLLREGRCLGRSRGHDFDGMMREAAVLKKIAKNVVIKLPLTWDGLKACKTLTDDGVKTNVTLCFAANQALLAAKAGATYISPFIGRLDDIHLNGMELISEIRTNYDNYDFKTEILAARSARSTMSRKRR